MKKIVGNRNILLLPAIHIVSNVKSITVFIKFNTIGILLWQPLDQCPIAAQVINLKEQISSRNMSCVFTRGNHNSILPTIYISILGPCYDFSMPILMSVLCPHVHYSSTMYLPQGQHAIYMCSDVILSTLLLISVVHTCTMCTP